MPNGILIVNKPAGWTSQDVAAKLRGVFHEKHVGHGGTLDPMATGVLPIFLGRATRAVPFFEHADKEYEAVLRLGLVTDTQDTTGHVLEEHPVDITPEQLESVLPAFRGEIQQLPPMYSAIKVNGQKLYALARKGKEVVREPRPVTIYRLELLDEATGNRQQATEIAFPLGGRCPSVNQGTVLNQGTVNQGTVLRLTSQSENRPLIDYRLRIHCSKGTYVRTLCHDIGAALGCGGCMAALVRTRAGRYGIAQAHTMEEILAAPDPAALLLPVDSLFADRPRCTLSEAGERLLRNGAAVPAGKLAEGEYRVYGPGGDFLALCAAARGELRTVKSFFEPN